MRPIEIKKDVYWVGGIDWKLRNFHGYLTQRGSTYNAYLIIDEKITLIDTVKHYLYDELIERISHIVDPSKIDYVVQNHVEMDHSGGLPKIMELAKNAKMFCSPNAVKGLKLHYNMDNWNCEEVKTGDTINIGKRNLSFINTPMVHWPDNMHTYCPEEKILFSNDAFGQHLASTERFDDEYPLDILMEEARKYYANIVLPYGRQVQKALNDVSDFDIEIICPSHGLIWRKHLAEIIQEYVKWSKNETVDKALIIYDSMWGSTEKIAYAIQRAFEDKRYYTEMLDVKHTHYSDIMTEVMTAKYICVGCPTLNNGILPTMSAFLTYFKGLAPKNRTAMAFGSYGWGGQSVGIVEKILKDECKFDMLDNIKIQYIPTDKQLEEITENLSKQLPEPKK